MIEMSKPLFCYGLTHDSFVVEYQLKDDCMSHDLYDKIKEMDWSAREVSVRDVLKQAERDLGDGVLIEFDRDIATTATCVCGHTKDIFNTVNRLCGKDIVCEKCGKSMQFETVHTINGEEDLQDINCQKIMKLTEHIYI